MFGTLSHPLATFHQFHPLNRESIRRRGKMPTVHLLDYVAGNIRSLVNAIEKLGYQVDWVRSPEDVPKAEVRLLQ